MTGINLLTPLQSRKINTHVKKDSGNSEHGTLTFPYDGDTCVCPQLISYSLLCKWFRIAVLPLDKLLFAELYHTDDMRKCIVCGASFASKSNSVKYCPDCRKRITRRQAAERMRKKRTLVTQ